ncbi:hypothetical protein GCM10009552_28880 [Rothia nasimurium]
MYRAADPLIGSAPVERPIKGREAARSESHLTELETLVVFEQAKYQPIEEHHPLAIFELKPLNKSLKVRLHASLQVHIMDTFGVISAMLF